jgi:hypothetical protein
MTDLDAEKAWAGRDGRVQGDRGVRFPVNPQKRPVLSPFMKWEYQT